MSDIDINEETVEEHEELSPLDLLNALVEENKDDIDFIVKATKIKEALIAKGTAPNNEAEVQLAAAKEETARIKKLAYDTFMGITLPDDNENIEIVEEKSTPKVEDLIKEIGGNKK